MERDERLSYLMLFCSILVAAKHRTPVHQAVHRAPLSGGARRLSEMLADRGGAAESAQAAEEFPELPEEPPREAQC
jgi:hypothetical protein